MEYRAKEDWLWITLSLAWAALVALLLIRGGIDVADPCPAGENAAVCYAGIVEATWATRWSMIGTSATIVAVGLAGVGYLQAQAAHRAENRAYLDADVTEATAGSALISVVGRITNYGRTQAIDITGTVDLWIEYPQSLIAGHHFTQLGSKRFEFQATGVVSPEDFRITLADIETSTIDLLNHGAAFLHVVIKIDSFRDIYKQIGQPVERQRAFSDSHFSNSRLLLTPAVRTFL